MTTETRTNDKLKISIRGFAAMESILKQKQNMTILKVGVQVNPRERDYYTVYLFGPKAYWASRHIGRGMVLEVEGNLDFSVREGKRGMVSPKLQVFTNDVTITGRGRQHYAKVSIDGELTAQPYSTQTANGTPVSSFEVKVMRKVKGKSKPKTQTVAVSTFGDLATACKAYLYRRRRVSIEGDLRLAVYTGRDKLQKASMDVQARNVTLAGGAALSTTATEAAA